MPPVRHRRDPGSVPDAVTQFPARPSPPAYNNVRLACEALSMIIEPGDKLLISHRRLYESDQPRFFVGAVDAYEAGIVRVAGYSWVREPLRGELKRKDDLRTKIFAIASPGLICYLLPGAVELHHLELRHGPQQHQVVLTDGAGFSMDLTDRNPALRLGSAA